ncbi:MAG: 4-amino-4-deoxy-L-arabinose transferase-like glycosyltransferase [Halieaceae bacterium]
MNRIERLWGTNYFLFLILALLALVYHHWQIISAPFPLDYYEGTTLLITQIFAEGGNPYTREYQPGAMYVYPPLFNLLVAPLTWFVDNDLILHRTVCGVFILASCLLVARAVLDCGADLIDALAAACTFYAALLFYATPISSTNAMGVFLFLTILYLPWRASFSLGSLVLATLLGVAAFYSKQYFILAVGLVGAYVFIYQSMLRAMAMGLLFVTLVVSSLWIVNLTSPYYLDNTLFSTAISTALLQNTETAVLQYTKFLWLYWPLLLLALYQLYLTVHGPGGQGLLSLIKPGIRSVAEHRGTLYFWFCLALSAVIVFFSLARNPGNYLTYLFQLLSPLLLIGVFGGMSKLRVGRRYVALPVLLCLYMGWSLLPQDFSTTEAGWKRVDELVSQEENILASQILITDLLRHDRRVFQDGHTFYFPLAAEKPHWFFKDAKEDTVKQIWSSYLTGLYRDIERQHFDLIVVSPWDFHGIFVVNPPPFSTLTGPKFLKKFYYMDEQFPLSMTERHGGGTYNMKVWRPRPKPKVASSH